MSVWSLYALASGSSEIHQIVDQRIDPGIAEMLVSGDGNINDEHASIISRRPIVRFTTTGISQALDLAGTSGLVIDQSGSTNQVVLYFAQRDQGSGWVAGSNHIKITVTDGLLVPVTLRGSHEADDPVTIEYALHAVGADLSTAPIAMVASQALGSYTPVIDEVYTVGPWYVNGTLINDIRDLNIDFGLEVAAPSGSGAIWGTTVFLRRRKPVMTCTCLDLAAVEDDAGITLGGAARSGITRAFLRKKAAGGGLVTDVTAEHIKFELTEGRINPDPLGGAHQDDALAALRVTPTYDGSNAPIAYTKDVAINGT